jgi:hypothetical protein
MQHIFTRSTFLALAFIAISVCLSGQSTRDLFSRPGLSIGAYHWNFFDGTWNTSPIVLRAIRCCVEIPCSDSNP